MEITRSRDLTAAIRRARVASSVSALSFFTACLSSAVFSAAIERPRFQMAASFRRAANSCEEELRAPSGRVPPPARPLTRPPPARPPVPPHPMPRSLPPPPLPPRAALRSAPPSAPPFVRALSSARVLSPVWTPGADAPGSFEGFPGVPGDDKKRALPRTLFCATVSQSTVLISSGGRSVRRKGGGERFNNTFSIFFFHSKTAPEYKKRGKIDKVTAPYDRAPAIAGQIQYIF